MRTGVPPGWTRRVLDLAAATLGLLILGGPLLVLMAVVRLTSRGPALFTQVRVGQGGRPFVMYKLRTMSTGNAGAEVTAPQDPRVTRVGRVLRSTSLDEVPQLWNVLRGDMTLVGPRPETPRLAAKYPADCRWVFGHRPGLTGPAQVRMRDSDVLSPGAVVDENAYLQRLVPVRTAMDATYLQRPSLAATVRVLAETVRHLSGRPMTSAASAAVGTGH